MNKIKDSPHYSRLKESVEYRYARKQFLIALLCFGLGALILILPISLVVDANDPSDAFAFAGFAFTGIVYLCFIAYFTYRWLEIFLHIDSYIFCEVVLDQPHVEGRGGVKFTVTFTDRHGKHLKRDTGTMFSSHYEPYLEDYNNQKVLIGYNEETDRVVVIKRLEG